MPNKQSVTAQRKMLRTRAAELAQTTTGPDVERRYIVRNMLRAEFGITASYAYRLSAEVIKVNPAASELGKLGGKSTSEAKQAASRANGKLGGRPRKDTAAPPAPRRKREAKEQS